LFHDPAFRRFVQTRITDPIIRSEWQTFEQGLSSAEQRSYIAPAMARITDLLSRPSVRGALSQPNPRVSIERLLAEGKWLVVALSPGTLGDPASRLLSATVAYLTWAAIEKRAAIPESQRRQVMLVMDEIQALMHMPVGLETFFERFRSLNCACVAATQAASRLSEPVRQALFANAGTLVVWRSGADEAARLARELVPLGAGDLMGLDRHQVAVRVHTGSRSVVVTGHTEPLPPPTEMADHIRRLSAERYGRDLGEVEQELRQRMEGDDPHTPDHGFGRTGRAT
jgi:Type IV secretion-system coupling protein DNA-binding domain